MDQESIKIGSAKQSAIKCILTNVSPKSYSLLCSHLAFSHGQRNSGISDQLLSLDWIWPGSMAPRLPTDAEDVARRAAAPVARRIIPSHLHQARLAEHRPPGWTSLPELALVRSSWITILPLPWKNMTS